MPTIRTIQITWDVFQKIENRTFTCNKDGDVFVPRGIGWTPNQNRSFLQKKYPVLGDIANQVCLNKKDGGRFIIKKRGAFLVVDNRPVCRFKLDRFPSTE